MCVCHELYTVCVCGCISSVVYEQNLHTCTVHACMHAKHACACTEVAVYMHASLKRIWPLYEGRFLQQRHKHNYPLHGFDVLRIVSLDMHIDFCEHAWVCHVLDMHPCQYGAMAICMCDSIQVETNTHTIQLVTNLDPNPPVQRWSRSNLDCPESQIQKRF